ncbi:MAG: DUF6295 family protein [Candidatus Tectimicrobiota bacterium]
MCTMLAHQAKIEGCGKGTQGWFDLREVTVSFDHPFNLRQEHALNVDFVNEAEGPGARVAVELTLDSARQLAQAILAMVEQAESSGFTEGPVPSYTAPPAHTHAHTH